MSDAARAHYEACAQRVLAAVRAWGQTHREANAMRWRDVTPTIAVLSGLDTALVQFADNDAARELGRRVVKAEPGATWLMFALAMTVVHGPHWHEPDRPRA